MLGGLAALLQRLSELWNAAARLIPGFNAHWRANYWLPVFERILLKIAVVIYTVSQKKPVQTYFLSELCQISTDCENFWHTDSK